MGCDSTDEPQKSLRHAVAPVVASIAANSPPRVPRITRLPAIAGVLVIHPAPSSRFHASAPLERFTAYITPSKPPKMMFEPLATAVARIRSLVGNRQT